MKDIWEFKYVGKRNNICYTPESIRHPAKMELNMCRKIIKLYSKKGDILLDPMAGIGTTLIEAMIMGRNAIGIEYEQKFVEEAEKNISKTKKSLKFMAALGDATVFKGDSRKLSKLIKEADHVIFSPPYSEALQGAGMAKKGHYDDPKLADRLYKKEDEEALNIGNLPHGKMDVIMTSPPYGHESTVAKPTKFQKEGKWQMGHSKELKYTDKNYRLKKNEGNVGKYKLFKNVPCKKEEAEHHDTRPERKGTAWEYTKEVKVGIDTIFTSPPYENITRNRGKTEKSTKVNIEKNNIQSGSYSNDKNNVGNKIGKTYLSEMLKIYQECFKVLKRGGGYGIGY